MSFLSRLFGSTPKEEAPAAEAEHAGYAIAATPMPDGGQFRLHGTISKNVGGETRTHTLIRADLFADRNACAEATLTKAKQVIAEQGDAMFDTH